MADIKRDLAEKKTVRGIIIANDFSSSLALATSLIQNVELMRYNVKFEFEKVV